MDYRPAKEADLRTECALFNRAQGGLYRQHGFARNETPFERFAAPHRHLLAHDSTRCFVAEVDGQVVAFAAAMVRDQFWYLSALFVDPDFQGRGSRAQDRQPTWIAAPCAARPAAHRARHLRLPAVLGAALLDANRNFLDRIDPVAEAVPLCPAGLGSSRSIGGPSANRGPAGPAGANR
ncbi:MAG: GNAT family N-acetyltransferase [Chloroflexi bacterium]|nr:MAG: GNAT family N-acetyltransferase [Chloroflexota bacterium]